MFGNLSSRFFNQRSFSLKTLPLLLRFPLLLFCLSPFPFCPFAILLSPFPNRIGESLSDCYIREDGGKEGRRRRREEGEGEWGVVVVIIEGEGGVKGDEEMK